MMLIAHLSDLHVVPEGQKMQSVDTEAMLVAAIRHLTSRRQLPDAVIVTGDLVDEGSAAEYRNLRRLLGPIEVPLYLMMGNHDGRDGFRAVFGDLPYLPPSGFVHYAADIGPLRLVVLDTLVEGSNLGALDQGRLEWLEDTLAQAPERPTIVAMHHPPFDGNIAYMDRGKPAEAAQLAALLRRNPQIIRLLTGHLHRVLTTGFGGVVATGAPSTAHQLHLDTAPDPVKGYVFEPPGYLLHHWGGGALTSHFVPVGDHPVRAFGT